MAAWPASLPEQPLADGYTESALPNVVRSEMEIGPAKLRRRYTAEIKVYAVQFMLTTAQVATLETFYDSTLNGGVDPFDWVDHRTGATVSYRFRSRPMYYTAAPGHWRCSSELETVP